MSELNEIEKIVQGTLSPSSINLWYKCPRAYYYNYIEKVKVKPSIHLIKGGIVHKVLEEFFKKFEDNLEEHLFILFEKIWEDYDKRLKDLELSEEDLNNEKQDCKNILTEYYVSLSRKMNALIHSGKAENLRHAYFLIRPKFREMYVKSEELKCCGYIDRISEDYDGILTLADYKTSSKFGVGLPESYKRQLALYALLYESQEKRLPDYVSVIFLRYGEEYLFEVTPSLIKYARDTIELVYSKTRSLILLDYPKQEGSLCRWCDLRDICTGKDEFDKKKRIEKIKELISI